MIMINSLEFGIDRILKCVNNTLNALIVVLIYQSICAPTHLNHSLPNFFSLQSILLSIIITHIPRHFLVVRVTNRNF